MQAGKGDLSIDFLGEQKSPILTIDNFSGNLNAVRQQAIASADYTPDQISKYPGVRAPLPRDYIIACLQPLLPYIYKIFKIPGHLKPNPKGSYSLITKTEDQLSPWQTIPHFDKTSPYMIAFIHYLNEGNFGSTGFFRHKATGFDYIDEGRKDQFLHSVQQFLSSDQRPLSYVDAEHPEFELYHSVPYKTNRMILFRGYMLHSGLVNLPTDISDDPLTGRLTANMFVDFR
ncbi:DUF6445 family protein [Marinimicrobium sp. ABcell2]|uniref:DUF6445 family protein n=1 Tax=Marinimicrobium sp. ABcell2 TaxID=3069751 RepID=UPI0027B2A52E|nr:DUF6445 family protein [Marinimicrobium sp. ABcell2]MDQ2075961.1 DUF6445 family protein [Marinimicrobium sp. ABcell2]